MIQKGIKHLMKSQSRCRHRHEELKKRLSVSTPFFFIGAKHEFYLFIGCVSEMYILFLGLYYGY